MWCSLVTGFETGKSGFMFEKPGLKPVSARNRDSKLGMAKPGLNPGLAIVLTYPQTRVTKSQKGHENGKHLWCPTLI